MEARTGRVRTRALSRDVLGLWKFVPPETRRPLHAHAAGALTLTLGGAYEEEFEHGRHVCTPGGLQYKPPGEPHTTETGAVEGQLFVLALAPDLAGPGGPLAPLDRAVQLAVGAPLVTALALSRTGSVATATGRRRAADRVRTLVRSLAHGVRSLEADAPDWVAAIVREIDACPGAAWSLDRVARRAGVSPRQVARRLRRERGCTLGELVHRRRVDRSVTRLLRTDDAVSAIAHDLGFSDQSHFTRVFRRETAWTPAAFRRAARAVR